VLNTALKFGQARLDSPAIVGTDCRARTLFGPWAKDIMMGVIAEYQKQRRDVLIGLLNKNSGR